MKKFKFWKIKVYSVPNSKENVKIAVKSDTTHFSASIVLITMVEIIVTRLEVVIARTVASRTMIRRTASSSRGRKPEIVMLVYFMLTVSGKTSRHKM
jgi:hypothetical protein